MRWIAMVGLLALAACSAPSGPDVAEQRAPQAIRSRGSKAFERGGAHLGLAISS